MAHIDVDALPYIDRDYDPSSSDPSVLSVSSAVNDLINQERQRVSKNETALHPSVGEEFALFKENPELQAELDRITSFYDNLPETTNSTTSTTKPKPPSMAVIDTSRYRLDPPKGEEETSISAWQKAVDNGYAQLEHQSNRLVSLQLLDKYGSNAWKTHAFQLEYIKKQLESELQEIQNEEANLNKKRKLDQMKMGNSLQLLDNRWKEMVSQNLQVKAALTTLENEVEYLRREKEQLDAQKQEALRRAVEKDSKNTL